MEAWEVVMEAWESVIDCSNCDPFVGCVERFECVC